LSLIALLSASLSPKNFAAYLLQAGHLTDCGNKATEPANQPINFFEFGCGLPAGLIFRRWPSADD
jgi:hypothetical protein